MPKSSNSRFAESYIIVRNQNCAAYPEAIALSNFHKLILFQIWSDVHAVFNGMQEVSFIFCYCKLICDGKVWPNLWIVGFEVDYCFSAILPRLYMHNF